MLSRSIHILCDACTHIRSSQPSPVTTSTEPYSWQYRHVLYRTDRSSLDRQGKAVMYKALTGTSPTKGQCHTLVFPSVICSEAVQSSLSCLPKLRLPSAVWTADTCVAHEQGTGGSTSSSLEVLIDNPFHTTQQAPLPHVQLCQVPSPIWVHTPRAGSVPPHCS